MKLSEYFEKATGLGILATSDSAGAVNAAVYAKPHFIDEETIAFIMADKLTHHNVEQNPRAAYLFKEAGEKYVGKRLYLRKTKEVQDPEAVREMRRKKFPEVSGKYSDENKFIVTFKIDKVLPLLGDKEEVTSDSRQPTAKICSCLTSHKSQATMSLQVDLRSKS